MELDNEKVEKQIPPQFAKVILKLNNNLKDSEIILAEVSVSSPSDINSDKSSVSESVERTGWMKYLGMILAVLSGLFYSLVLLLVKVLDAYHPFSLSAWRQLGNVIPSIPMVLYFRYWRNEPIFDEVWPLGVNHNWKHVVGLGFRGCLGATVVILRFYSLEYLTIADSTVVSYSGPIFIVIMAHFILNEKCGVTPIITGLWTLLGVILILRPPFLTGNEMNTQLLIGAGISLASVLCQSGVTILVRKIRKIHFSVMTLAFGCFGLLQSLIVTFSAGVFSVPQGPRDIFLTALLALLSFCGQIGIIVALKLEQAGPVSLIRSCDIIFVFLLQIIFLNVLPDLFSILGACIVIVGVFVTAARKWLSTLPDDSPRKQTFSFLLR